jgi:hypothetical protein
MSDDDNSALTLILVFILGFLFSKMLPNICEYVNNENMNFEMFTLGATEKSCSR